MGDAFKISAESQRTVDKLIAMGYESAVRAAGEFRKFADESTAKAAREAEVYAAYAGTPLDGTKVLLDHAAEMRVMADRLEAYCADYTKGRRDRELSQPMNKCWVLTPDAAEAYRSGYRDACTAALTGEREHITDA